LIVSRAQKIPGHEWAGNDLQEEGNMAEIYLPGKYSKLEEAVLLYLYDHPGWDASTFTLSKVLTGASQVTSQKPADVDATSVANVQFAIETLIKDRLVSGDRQLATGKLVYFEKLKLTTKGESQAIEEKRRPRKLIHSIPMPDRNEY
jgi:hypothetical protein